MASQYFAYFKWLLTLPNPDCVVVAATDRLTALEYHQVIYSEEVTHHLAVHYKLVLHLLNTRNVEGCTHYEQVFAIRYNFGWLCLCLELVDLC